MVRTVVGALLDALVRFFGFRGVALACDEETALALSSWTTERSCSEGSVATVTAILPPRT